MIKNLVLPDPETLIDAVEVHGRCILGKEQTSGKEIVEVCLDQDADFWSVYVHRFNFGGVEAVADCDTREEAEELAKLIETIGKNWAK